MRKDKGEVSWKAVDKRRVGDWRRENVGFYLLAKAHHIYI